MRDVAQSEAIYGPQAGPALASGVRLGNLSFDVDVPNDVVRQRLLNVIDASILRGVKLGAISPAKSERLRFEARRFISGDLLHPKVVADPVAGVARVTAGSPPACCC
jgi:hypothetical protein